jgi:hypothetical protein
MIFLEVIPQDEEVEKQFVNAQSIANIICTHGKIIVYNW